MQQKAAAAQAVVWLIEDHDDYRTLVAQLINHLEGFQCPRTFVSCEAALAALGALGREPGPAIVLSDVGLPGMNGIEGIRRIKALSPDTLVVMLTVYDDHKKVFDAICAGASGYLLKSASEEAVVTALREVMAGGAPMHPRVARMVLERFAAGPPVPPARAEAGVDYGLSAREKDILEWMVQGLTKKEIADRLSLSPHTVDFHLRKIYDKLHVHTRTGAVAKVIQEKLL